MNIQNFSDYKVKVRYFPEFQSPYCFGGGEFLEDIGLKSVIYCALCNEDFLNNVNSLLDNKISLDTDINDIELSNVKVLSAMTHGDWNLKEEGIPDTNHEGGFIFKFTINDVDIIANLYGEISDIQGANSIIKCSYIEIYEGYLKFKLII